MQGRVLRSSSVRGLSRLHRAVCETLEQRQLLSYTPSVSGNSSVNEGSNYSLNLTWGGSPASSFVIDWGDGTNADLITGASSAAHVYDDNGPGGAPYSIRAGAAVASPSGDVSGPHISVTASGKYLTLTEASGGVAINRFLADGTADTSFGSGGSTFLGGNLWTPYTFIRAVPAAAGGGFIVGGSDTEWENYGLKVWRFTDSGSLDTTYGTNGVSELGRFTDGYSIDGRIGFAVQSDGSVVAADETMVFVDGVNYVGNKNTVVRFTPNGAVDTNFGSNGFVAFDGVYYGQTADGIAVGNDDKTLIGTVEADPNSGNASLVLNRLSNDGSIASSTMAPIDQVWINEAGHVTATADGSIYLAGAGYDDVGSGTAVARFTSDGYLDTTFGNNGTMWTRDVPAESLSGLLPMSDGSVAVAAGSGGSGTLWRMYQDGGSTIAEEIIQTDGPSDGLADGGSGNPLIVQPMNGRLGFAHFAATKPLIVHNVQPTATLVTESEGLAGLFTVTLTNPVDPSSADTLAGFRYSFSTTYANLANSYDAAGIVNYNSYEFEADGNHSVWVRIFDKDNGSSDYNPTITSPTLNIDPAKVSSSQITLDWADNASTETGWRIQRSIDGKNWDWTHNLVKDSTEYTDTSVADGTRYWYRVRAYGTPGTASDTAYSPKRSATSLLAAPSNIQIESSSTGVQTLTWTDNSERENGFVVLEQSDDQALHAIGHLSAGKTSFVLTGTHPAGDFRFVVRAVSDTQVAHSIAYDLTVDPIPEADGPNVLAAMLIHDAIGLTPKIILDFDTAVADLAASDILVQNLRTGAGIPVSLSWAGNRAIVTLATNDGIPEDGDYQLRILAGSFTDGVGKPLHADYSSRFSFFAADLNQDRHVDVADFKVVTSSFGESDKSYSQGDLNFDGLVDATDLGIFALQWNAQYHIPVSDFHVDAISATQINLAWNDTAVSETAWQVYRSTDGINFTELTTLSADTEVFENTGLQAGQQYWYQVRAIGNGQDVVASERQGAHTYPAAAEGLSATPSGSTAITLSWTDVAQNEEYYIIYRSLEGAGGPYTAVTALPAGSHSFVDSGIAPETTYYYHVASVVHDKESPSNTASATTSSLPSTGESSELSGPTAPSDLAVAVVTERSVRMRWKDQSHTESAYVITVRKAETQEAIASLSVPAGTEGYVLSVDAPETRIFELKAVRGDLSSSSITATCAAPSLAPSDVTVSMLSTNSMQVTWKDNTVTEKSYTVLRQVNGGEWLTAAQNLPANADRFVDNVTPGTTVAYKVVAYLDRSNSFRAVESTPSSTTVVPHLVVLNSAVLSGSNVEVSWSYDYPEAISGFTIQFKKRLPYVPVPSSTYPVEVPTWHTVATAGPIARSASVDASEVAEGATYLIRVIARIDVDETKEDSSQTRVITRPPAAPSDVHIQTGAGQNVTINWQNNSTNNLGFLLKGFDANGNERMGYNVHDPDVTRFSILVADRRIVEYAVAAYSFSEDAPYESELSERVPATLNPPASDVPLLELQTLDEASNITSGAFGTEGAAPAKAFRVHVNPYGLHAASNVTVHLQYSGSATFGTDFSAPECVTFLPNQTSVDVPLTIFNDEIAEEPESIVPSLVVSQDYWFSNPTAVITVIDSTASASLLREGKVIDPSETGVLIVNDADRDADDIPDMADFTNGRGVLAGPVAALKVKLPDRVPLSELVLELAYSASDPMAGQYDSQLKVYTPASGHFRLWKSGNPQASPVSVLSGGAYIGPQVYSGAAALQALGFSEQVREVTFSIEAVRATGSVLGDDTASPISVEIGTTGGGELLHQDLNLVALEGFRPDAFRDGARDDGAVMTSSTDHAFEGADPRAGISRVYSSAKEWNLGDGGFGNGWTLTQVPQLFLALNGAIVRIGSQTLVFDRSYESWEWRILYSQRDGLGAQLVRDAAPNGQPTPGGGYTLTLADQSVWTFWGDNAPAPQCGMPRLFMSPERIETTFSYTPAGLLQNIVTRETTYHFEWQDASSAARRIESISIADSGGSPWRMIEYQYYAGEAGGSVGDLKRVKVMDAVGAGAPTSGTLTGFWRYEYNTGSLLTSVVDLKGASRATEGAPLILSSNANAVPIQIFTYSDGKVSSQQRSGEGTSSAVSDSGRSVTAYTEYQVSSFVGSNAWHYKAIRTISGTSNVSTSFSNSRGQLMLESRQDENKKYFTYHEYNRNGNEIRLAMPSAYDESALAVDLFTDPTLNHVFSDKGVVYRSTFSNSAGQDVLLEKFVQSGYSDASAHRKQIDKFEYLSLSDRVLRVAKHTQYAGDGSSAAAVTTSFGYSYDVNRRTSMPWKVTATSTSSETQNGTTHVTEAVYDAFGSLTSFKHADGHTITYQYHPITGTEIKRVLPLPSNPDVRVILVDHRGRVREYEDPNGGHHTVEYADTPAYSEVQTKAPASATGPSRPIQAVRESFVSNTIDTFTLDAASPTTVLSLTRASLDGSGRVIYTDRYYDLTGVAYSASGGISIGSGALKYRTEYHYDVNGNRSYEKNANGTERTTVYDNLGRPTQEMIGATVIRAYQYDGGGAGDSNLTKVIEYPDTVAGHQRETTSYYDWRDRQVASSNGIQLRTLHLDNLDQVTGESIYDDTLADVSLSGGNVNFDNDGEVVVSDSTALRARTLHQFDNQGREFRITQYSVDQEDGTLSGSALITNIFHDGRGNITKTVSANGKASTWNYDGDGRLIQTSVGDSTAPVESTLNDYDANGNLIRAVTTQSGPAGDRTTYQRYSYDAANRLVTSVNYGTNGGSVVDNTSSLPIRTYDDGRNEFLRSDYAYDASGNLDTVTDPRGIVTKRYFDPLGRLTAEIEAYTDGTPTNETNARSWFEYNELDQQTSSNIVLPGNATIRTELEYDSRGRLETKKFPSTSAGTAGGIGNEESYTYNELDELKTKTERTGVVHTYTHDPVGRITHDDASIPSASGVDSRVDGLVFEYDAMGRVISAKTQGSLPNEVKREYNGFGQLEVEWQQQGGSVDSSSPKVTYSYGDDESGSRLEGILYPHGGVVAYIYNALDGALGRPTSMEDPNAETIESYEYLGAGTIVGKYRPEIDALLEYYGQSGAPSLAGDSYGGFDRFGRVVDQDWVIDSTPVDRYQYDYDAGSNLLVRKNLVNGAFSELFHENGKVGDATGSNPNTVAYDRFGRVLAWQRGTLSASAGNGRLNSISTPQRDQHWSYDSQGNWLTFYDGQRLNTTAYDSRNRATTATQGSTNVNYYYDENGALTSSTDGERREVKYDAWGHPMVVTMFNGSTQTGSAEYRYDALGRTTRETTSFTVGNFQTDLFYDRSGHVISEDRSIIGSSTTTHYRNNIWGIDGNLIYVENQSTTNGTSRLYALQDAQGNTTTVIGKDSNGDYVVKERYVYDPHGIAMVLRDDWSGYDMTGGKPYGNDPKSSWNQSALDFRWLYGQQRWFSGDKLYHTANGSYDPVLSPSVQPRSDAAEHTNGSTSILRYWPGELRNTVSGIGTQLAFMTRDVFNDYLYAETTILTNGRWSLGSNNAWSNVGQILDAGETNWTRATLSAVPLIGSGYNAVTGEELLTGRQLHGLDYAGAWAGLIADIAFAGAGAAKISGYNPAIRLPRLGAADLNKLSAVQGRVDAYARGALDYAVRKALQKGWTQADNAKMGRLVDRYTALAAKRLNARLVEANSPYRVSAQFARDAQGANILDGSRPLGSGIVDLAITDAAFGKVFSIWDTTVSWRWNSAGTNAKYLRLFNPEEGFVREINPSIRRP